MVMVYRSVFVLEGRRQRGANERKRRKEKRERERGKKSDKQGENGEGGGGRQQFAAAEKVMEFRELAVCGWRQWRRERRGRKEGRKEGRKPGRGKRRGTPVAEKSHAVWKRSILFFG